MAVLGWAAMLKQRSDEFGLDTDALALAAAGQTRARCALASAEVSAVLVRYVAVSPGGGSSVTELDTIELSDDDDVDDMAPGSLGLQVSPEIKNAECVPLVLPSVLATASTKDSSQMNAVSDFGCLAVPVSCTSALAESTVAVPLNVGMQEAGTGPSVASGHPFEAACASSLLDSPVFAFEVAASHPVVDAVAAGPTKRARTRWGRCGVSSCQAPLRLLLDHVEGRPFLGCSSWKSSNPASCKFRTAFPMDRREELPSRMRVLRRVRW